MIHNNYINNNYIDLDKHLSLTSINDSYIKQYVMSYNNKTISYTMNYDEHYDFICEFGIDKIGSQIRLNLLVINNNNNGLLEFINFWENYFYNIYKDKYTFQSVIHQNNKLNSTKIILHLKKQRGKIITNLNSNNTGITWLDLEKMTKFTVYGSISINCLWFNNNNNTFGLSLDWSNVNYISI
jgi:hypothetical protein